jgi:hypothetical protein
MTHSGTYNWPLMTSRMLAQEDTVGNRKLRAILTFLHAAFVLANSRYPLHRDVTTHLATNSIADIESRTHTDSQSVSSSMHVLGHVAGNVGVAGEVPVDDGGVPYPYVTGATAVALNGTVIVATTMVVTAGAAATKPMLASSAKTMLKILIMVCAIDPILTCREGSLCWRGMRGARRSEQPVEAHLI